MISVIGSFCHWWNAFPVDTKWTPKPSRSRRFSLISPRSFPPRPPLGSEVPIAIISTQLLDYDPEEHTYLVLVHFPAPHEGKTGLRNRHSCCYTCMFPLGTAGSAWRSDRALSISPRFSSKAWCKLWEFLLRRSVMDELLPPVLWITPTSDNSVL